MRRRLTETPQASASQANMGPDYGHVFVFLSVRFTLRLLSLFKYCMYLFSLTNLCNQLFNVDYKRFFRL